MRRQLTRHPDTPCHAVSLIEVELARPSAGVLSLRYIATGDIGALALPAEGAPARADELWRRTCFEAFVRPRAGEAYEEFNLSPSTQWAAYAFDGYRRGMRPVEGVRTPGIGVRATAETFELRAAIPIPPHTPADLGLSAVIEEAGGGVSYWALAHPTGKPDFHHADGFALQLPAMGDL